MAEQTSLGALLRQEREKQEITIEQLASITKINVRFLHALEANDFKDLPAKPFIRGFVTSYTRALGLNSEKILAQFGFFIDEKVSEQKKSDSSYTGYAFEKKEVDKSRTILWIIMGSFIILGGVGLLLLKPTFKQTSTAQIEKLKNETSKNASIKTDVPSSSPGDKKNEETKKLTEKPADNTTKPADTKTEPPAQVKAEEQTPQKPAEQVEVKVDVKADVKEVKADLKIEAPVALKPIEPMTAKSEEAQKPAATEVHEIIETQEAQEAQADDKNKDPLNKGDAIPLNEVKEKVVFKSLTNVWVRYQSDDRTITRFMLLADKLLVIKARSKIFVQFSNQDSMQIKYKSSNYILPINSSNFAFVNNTPTMFFPYKSAINDQNNFLKLEALPLTPAP